MQVSLLGGSGRRLALTLALSAVLAIGMMGISAGSASAATCTSAAAISNTQYTIVPGSPLGTTDMTGKVNQADTVTASFTVSSACTNGAKVSLVSYAAPGPTWDPSTASQQQIYQQQTNTFSSGAHPDALTVMVPPGCFQIDLVVGDVIMTFNPPSVTYSGQGRLVDSDNGDPGCLPLF